MRVRWLSAGAPALGPDQIEICSHACDDAAEPREVGTCDTLLGLVGNMPRQRQELAAQALRELGLRGHECERLLEKPPERILAAILRKPFSLRELQRTLAPLPSAAAEASNRAPA